MEIYQITSADFFNKNKHYHFYYIKDLLGNVRETYVHPDANYKECMERTQYYPSGLPWAEQFSNSEGVHPWKYNGKKFVEMHGLDEYDSKARWYYPAICRTTTMDPLAETYYGTSPYAWCGNNTMRFVDPDGKRSKMIESDNILTFQAVYYTHPTDVTSAQQAIDFWNNQKDLQYTDMRGNNYSVMFDLSLKVVENPLTEASLTGKNTNSYQVLPRLSKVSPNPQAITTGLTNENYKIEVRLDRADGLTGAHEVGHTLIQPNEDFSEHSTSGIMTENAKDPQHGAFVSQETVNEIVESHQNKNLWSKIESLFK